MIAQAFFYNAIFFTYALVLTHVLGVRRRPRRLLHLPFALGNFLGPLLLGPAVRHGRPGAMIAVTYATSGVLLLVTAILFEQRTLIGAHADGALVRSIFFFASAAASAAYLTVSEVFPLEIRAHGDRVLLRGRHRRSAASSARRSSGS